MADGRVPPIRDDIEPILIEQRFKLGENWDPLFSIAPGLTDTQLKRGGLTRNLPGRPRAIRVSRSVADRLLEDLKTPPPSGPGLTSLTEITDLPAPTQLGPSQPFPTGPLGDIVIRRTPIVMHFTGDIAGGAAASELRAFGPVANPFRIRSIEIIPFSGVQLGQFLDIIISTDDDSTDTETPSGFSIFPLLLNFGTLPAADQQRGIQIPVEAFDIPISFMNPLTKQTIKARVFFAAPALALPNVDVLLIIEELSVQEMLTETAFEPTPVEQQTQPSTPLEAPAEEIVDTVFFLRVGTGMNGIGRYTSEETALAAARAAGVSNEGIFVVVTGRESGRTYFEGGSASF